MDEVRKQFQQDVINARDIDGPDKAIAGLVLQTYDIMCAAGKIAYAVNDQATFTDVLSVYDRIMQTVNGE